MLSCALGLERDRLRRGTAQRALRKFSGVVPESKAKMRLKGSACHAGGQLRERSTHAAATLVEYAPLSPSLVNSDRRERLLRVRARHTEPGVEAAVPAGSFPDTPDLNADAPHFSR